MSRSASPVVFSAKIRRGKGIIYSGEPMKTRSPPTSSRLRMAAGRAERPTETADEVEALGQGRVVRPPAAERPNHVLHTTLARPAPRMGGSFACPPAYRHPVAVNEVAGAETRRLGVSRSGPPSEHPTTLALIGLVAAGLAVLIYPESLVGYLGRNVAVRPVVHLQFQSQTVLAWRRKRRSLMVSRSVNIAGNQIDRTFDTRGRDS